MVRDMHGNREKKEREGRRKADITNIERVDLSPFRPMSVTSPFFRPSVVGLLHGTRRHRRHRKCHVSSHADCLRHVSTIAWLTGMMVATGLLLRELDEQSNSAPSRQASSRRSRVGMLRTEDEN